MQYQFVWKHFWKLWPKWYVFEETGYKLLYPKLDIYKVFFFFGPFQAYWWTCTPPLIRTKEWSRKIKELLLDDLLAMKFNKVSDCKL